MTPLHGIASRDDLPLPFPLVLGGAALALVVTFWIAAFAWRHPRLLNLHGRPLPRLTALVDHPVVSRGIRLLALAVWGVAAAALVFGADRIDNPVFGFVFVWLWVGIVPISLVLGQVYRRTNPLRALLRMTGATAPAPPQTTSSRLPAAGALMVFLYLELVEPEALTLPVLRGFVALWLAWVVGGTLLRGSRWIAKADPFEAFAATIARLSPWQRGSDGVLLLVNPLKNLGSWTPPRHLGILAAVLLGGTLFDAVSASAWWVRSTQDLDVDARLLGTAGLLVTVAAVFGIFVAATIPLRVPGQPWRATIDSLAPGLVPLVAGYFLAHYATMLYLEGQRTAIRFADPLGQGWDLFGFAEAAPDTTLLAFPMLIAVGQVAAIVAGHVAGALVTHDIALRLGGEQAVRAQVPLLAVMVVLTVGGLASMFGG